MGDAAPIRRIEGLGGQALGMEQMEMFPGLGPMKGPIERGLHAELTIGRPHDVLAIEEDGPRRIVGPSLIAITHDALALHYRGLGDELVGLPSNLSLLVSLGHSRG